MQPVLASSNLPLNAPANTYSPRQPLETANNGECPDFNNTSIHHRQTRPVQLDNSYFSDSTRNNLEIPYSDRETGRLTNKPARKTTLTDTDTSTLDSQPSATENINPGNTPVNKEAATQPAPPPEYPIPIEAESTYWQSTAQYILSGIRKLANAVLPTPSQALEHIHLDMPCFREEHAGHQYIDLPMNVDAIDSDLNSRGQPGSRDQPKRAQSQIASASTSFESEETDDSTAETAQRAPCVSARKHHSPLKLQEIYQQSLPIEKLSSQTSGDSGSTLNGMEDEQPELLISLYPHGILQLLFILFPETAVDILKSRLEKLSSTSVDTFEKLQKSRIGNRDKFRLTLETNLATLRENLNDLESDLHNACFQLAMLKNLRKFEHQYHVYSLESKMDADFLVQKGRLSSELLATSLDKIEGNLLKDPKPLKPTTWLRRLGYQCKEREFILRGAMGSLAKYQMKQSAQSVLTELMKHPPVNITVSGTDTGMRNTVNHYIREQPETVIKVLTYLVCLNVKQYRSISNIKAAKLVLTTGQDACTAESVRALLDRLTRQNLMPEPTKQLEHEIGRLHAERLAHALESSQTEASLPELMDQRQHILNLKLLNPEKTKPTSSGKPNRLVSAEREVSARLIHHFLTAQSSPGEPELFSHCFFLQPPTSDRIFTVLSKTSTTPEKSFYLATLRFIDAMNRSGQDDSYEGDLHWMQCHYDMTYHEQQLFIDLIDKAEPSQLLPFDHFEQNINALLRLATARKQTGLRPLNPDAYTYALSHLDFVWQEEENIEDIVAELYRKRYLRLLHYDPYTEFLSLFSDACNQGKKLRRTIAPKAGLLINALKKSGLSNALDFLYREGKGLISSLFSLGNPIHARITSTLSTMLKVAQQNPKFFRVMCGDFALLIPRLKSLLGYDTSITGLLENISLCIRGQALASLFSGDQPQQLDADPLKNPEIATVFRRYQLLRDMINIAETGLPVAEIFQGMSWHRVKEKAKTFLLNVSSTYLARQCVRHMKPPIIRLCNNLLYARDLMPSLTLRLTSDFLVSMIPEETARLAHHIGRRTSVIGGFLSFFLDPLILRFDRYQETINNVIANPSSTDARNELTSERKKVAGILGVSSVLSTAAILFVNTFKIIIFFSSPWLTTACIGIITFLGSSCFVARRYNDMDEIWTSLSETISEQMKRTFAADSPKAIEARKRIDTISKANLARLEEPIDPERSSWQMAKKNHRRIKLSQLWYRLPYKNKELIHQDIRRKIRAKRPEIMEEAYYLNHLLKASTLLKSAIKNPEKIIADPEQHTDFNQQLARLHFKPIPAGNFSAELTIQEETIANFLQYTYGTVDLGDSIEEIMDTIESYNSKLYLGAYLEHLACIHDLKSTFLHTNMATDEPQVQASARKPAGNGSKLSFPDVVDVIALRKMIKKADLEFAGQWLERERQVQERMMKTVTRQALLKTLEDKQKHTEQSIAAALATSLYKANLEIQTSKLNEAALRLATDDTHPSTQHQYQHQYPLLATHGCGYKPREACKHLAGQVPVA
ncbi:hypothetical protein [Endozoicomonas sp. SCSIO W0465]|uniref:hypothetical protein n=1 Tax=Endozoicomonas sp. SCSIO W0465 TaxID=2918516 RepID=UPI00207591D6|nr:hypothetical protein [Endozoicomonas sp. SCSIO W0465]USE34263.1 hypothetical protein MJO57_19135 [Endozoicomonas sp. SCSIO W0465]